MHNNLTHVEALLADYVAEGKIAGATSIIARRGEVIQQLAVGAADIESGRPMQSDTIFRIYSLTKPVTSVAVLMLYEDGLLALDDAVHEFIPAFADGQVFAAKTDAGYRLEPLQTAPTVAHLLTHTSGIGGTFMTRNEPLTAEYRAGNFDDFNVTLEQHVAKLARIPLLFQPGTRWRYGLSTDVLARIVEVVSGQTFGEFLHERLFAPLGMDDTGFYVPTYKARRLATLYSTGLDGRLRRFDTPETGGYTAPRTLQPGSSGLVSTINDYFRFAQMLLDGGQAGGERLLRPDTVALMTTGQLDPALLPYVPAGRPLHTYTRGTNFGLGVRVVNDLAQWGLPGSIGEYGWAGAANTLMWNDPRQQLVLLLFIQSFPFLHSDIDRRFKQLVYEALV